MTRVRGARGALIISSAVDTSIVTEVHKLDDSHLNVICIPTACVQPTALDMVCYSRSFTNGVVLCLSRSASMGSGSLSAMKALRQLLQPRGVLHQK